MSKIAIITRTKKGRENFLIRAIESVKNQTYSDYEHIIINDSGEPLNSSKLFKHLEEKYFKKIRVIDRPNASNAPDTIFTESVDASGDSEYVVIHDDDDTWHKDFLKQTVGYLDDNQGIGGVVVRADKIIEESKKGHLKQLKKTHYMPEMKAVSLYQQCFENQLTPIAFVYRRDAYEKVGKYDNNLPVCGDWEFGIRFLTQYDVDYLDPGFALANYHHRKSPKSSADNNSFANHSHRYYSNKIRNSYLRKELAKGELGVGYIMSQLNYEQNLISRYAKKVMPHFLIDKIKKRIQN